MPTLVLPFFLKIQKTTKASITAKSAPIEATMTTTKSIVLGYLN